MKATALSLFIALIIIVSPSCSKSEAEMIAPKKVAIMPESQSIQITESELAAAQISPATVVASVKFSVRHQQNGDYIVTYCETDPTGGQFTSSASLQNGGYTVLLGLYEVFTAQTSVGTLKFYLQNSGNGQVMISVVAPAQFSLQSSADNLDVMTFEVLEGDDEEFTLYGVFPKLGHPDQGPIDTE